MNNVNLNIFSTEYYSCDSKNNNIIIDKQKINCKHWSVDTIDCNITCSLNIVNNPTLLDCLHCQKREEITELTINSSIPKKINLQEKIIEPSLFTKVVNYTKAETSQLLNGKVSDEIYNKRKDICISCDYKTNPDPTIESIGWCKGGCGCKLGNPRAALSQKLYMPNLSCPLKKFGSEVGTGFNISDAVDSVKGAATAINETIKPNNE